jgi:hypothetical protein
VVAANQAGSEAVGRLGAVGEVETEPGSALGDGLSGLLTVALTSISGRGPDPGNRRPGKGSW